MEHELKYITFCVQKHITPLTICSYILLVRDKPLGAPASLRLANWSVPDHDKSQKKYKLREPELGKKLFDT